MEEGEVSTMNNDDGIILQMQEDGVWGIKEEPYCTVELQTKEDYEKLEEILEKQKPKKPKKIKLRQGTQWLCPACGNTVAGLRVDLLYCNECGQKLDWSVKDE